MEKKEDVSGCQIAAGVTLPATPGRRDLNQADSHFTDDIRRPVGRTAVGYDYLSVGQNRSDILNTAPDEFFFVQRRNDYRKPQRFVHLQDYNSRT
jgi:hypothetical protein